LLHSENNRALSCSLERFEGSFSIEVPLNNHNADIEFQQIVEEDNTPNNTENENNKVA